MTTTNQLKHLIIDDIESQGNREGVTPLFELSEKIANSQDREFLNEMQTIIQGINLIELDGKQLSTFLSFIHYSKINTEVILKYLYSSLPNIEKVKSQTSLLKNGLITRFIIERDTTFFNLRKIHDAIQLKENQPWIWVDCISYYSWENCVSEISNLLSKTDEGFKNLLLRIPIFEKRVGKENLIQGFKKWYPNLKQTDRSKLEKWSRKLGIKFGLSIHAERSIENIPFSQNQII